ncbi:hypothetical protein NLG97_g7923 [Lecanicillium saksenae]|uniref:Uncharacterized protein n=1 Tax=Lecanicillium saksenae TaxID=468837 RepID=A0ACC1QMS1_9HYPO|nr:hypothetical protein NLG97_g7923 [Lecanicillium saksenae]
MPDTGRGPAPVGAQWDVKPIRKPATANWDLKVSEDNVQKLQKGFVPEMMEDKWLCYADARDAQGAILVHFCRSWTGMEQIVLKLQLREDGKEDSAVITEITWEAQDGEEDLGEEEAKEDAVMLCAAILGCSLEIEEAD